MEIEDPVVAAAQIAFSAMSFVTTLTVQVAGLAAPLTFLIGMLTMVIIGSSFVAFEKRVASSGSVYAYIGHTFGHRWGFIAGWALLLTYFTFMAGATALVGNFLMAFLAELGLRSGHLWLLLSFGGILLSLLLAWRDTRITARIILALEAVSVLAILFVTFRILTNVPLSTPPFHPNSVHAWAGVGYGTIYAILSFAGFEGAATIGEETREPKRAIPVAIMGTVIISGLLFALASYAEVTGYGLDHVKSLAEADSPLSALSNRFVSRQFGMFIGLATATSACACTLGSLSAAARLVYTLGRAGIAPRLAVLHDRHRTPTRALLAVATVNIATLLLWGARAGAVFYGSSIVTIGILSLIMVYIFVAAADMIEAFRSKCIMWVLVKFSGPTLLIWPLWNSLYPVPRWPSSLWPYIVMIWVIGGGLLSFFFPRESVPNNLEHVTHPVR